MRFLVLALAASIAVVVVPEDADGQSRSRRVQVRNPSSVWQAARDGRHDRSRDSDCDSDSDRRRRGGVYTRTGNRRVDCRSLDRELDRVHDDWHRRNDRYRGDRRYREEHDRLHDRIAHARARSGCRDTRRSIEDIIFGRDDRMDRRDRDRDGGVLGRLPRMPDGRTTPRWPDDRTSRDGGVLDRLPRTPDSRATTRYPLPDGRTNREGGVLRRLPGTTLPARTEPVSRAFEVLELLMRRDGR